MKKTLLFIIISFIVSFSWGQNIDDNRISFSFTQYPLINIEEDFRTYEIRVEHGYEQSNQDSLTLLEAKKEQYARTYTEYKQRRDQIEIAYLKRLAEWQKRENANSTTQTPPPNPKPKPPVYPTPPDYSSILNPILSSSFTDASTNQVINIEGFKKGLGGSILTVDIQAIRNIRITMKKSGSGAKTKYKYTCEYQLPIVVRFETPTNGVVLEETVLQNTQSYQMKKYKSQYEFDVYWLQNKEQFYRELEAYARRRALNEVNTFLNDQLGYVVKTRSTEIYAVKRFKGYDYSDFNHAHATTVTALQKVGNDMEHESAIDDLEKALKEWQAILYESTPSDKKARVNKKVTAVVRCNIAEILFWLNRFEEVRTEVNLAENSGVMKAKNHARAVKNFYEDQERRWYVFH